MSVTPEARGMTSRGNGEYRARKRERRRWEQERSATQHSRTSLGTSVTGARDGPARRAAATTCGWCGEPIAPRSRGPIPKWCSPTCRHRAWEQTRAAASGMSAVRIVERRVEVRSPAAPTRRDWARLLLELARQLDDGRIYDRDLPALATALNAALVAYTRRPHARSQARRPGVVSGDNALSERLGGDALGEDGGE
jgi:hypothetical protein